MSRQEIIRTEGESPGWVFAWRPARRVAWEKWLALLIVAGGFALMVLGLRVVVSPPTTWAAPQAQVIHLDSDSPRGRVLARKAKEAGPFPAKYLLSSWQGMEGLEHDLHDATRLIPKRYVPVLRGLPQEESERAGLALRGEPVFPMRPLGPLKNPTLGDLIRVPEIKALSSDSASDWHVPLPAFEGEVSDLLAAQSWRFMLCLDEEGMVKECIALAGAGERGLEVIVSWLRSVKFRGQVGVTERWLALSVEFINQSNLSGSDGTDPE